MPSTTAGADAVYSRLRELIVEGVYQPGDRLAHPQLMDDLGCGRTPLREALSRLQGDGLVVVTPNAGARVAPAPLDSAEGMYALRILVEPPLLEARTPAMTAARLRELRAGLDAMRSAQHEANAFQRAHRSFHDAQRASFASPFLEDVVRSTYRHIHRHHQHYRTRPDDPAEWIELDRLTVEALEAGAARRARQILEFHLVEAALSLVLREEPENRLPTLLGVGRANGMRFGTDGRERIALPLAIWWTAPDPELPAMATATLRTDPALARPHPEEEHR